jgi:DNA-binding beta-propeller fold protein YncE
MRMPRRSTITVLAAGLALSTLALPATGQEPGETPEAGCPDGAAPAGFDDVSDDNVHAPAIDCGVELGLIRGTGETTFHPARALTRGQTATLLARTLDELGIELPPLASSPDFEDADATHGESLRRLAAADIVLGRGDGTVDPTRSVTREQLASVLVRTLAYVRNAEVEATETGRFDDTGDSVHEANIDAATEAGLFQGKGERRFDPRAATRRDQVASVIVRLHEAALPHVRGEVWSLDQGTDLIHVYDARSRERKVEIDVSPQTLAASGFEHAPTGDATVPHMIEFDSRERFAFIAATAGAVTIVIDTHTREVVEVLPTGAGSHHAAVTPDDTAVWVAAIGGRQMVEIGLTLGGDEPGFAIERRLDVAELLGDLEDEAGWEFPSYAPVCHQFSPDSGEAWVTLGPAWDQGGLFVLDLTSGTATAAFDPEEVRANCGVSVTDEHAVVNFSGQVVEGDDTEGEWYVFDRESRALLHTESSRGFDAHGLRLDPAGEQYWMVNRASDNGLVVDAVTFEVVREIDDIADAPDILDFSPDGRLLYISQRGPNPRSGAIHAAAGSQPGVAIVDTQTDETVEVLEPPTVTDEDGDVVNDVHGVAVRARGATS